MKLGTMCLSRWLVPLLLIWFSTFARGGTLSRNSSEYKFITPVLLPYSPMYKVQAQPQDGVAFSSWPCVFLFFQSAASSAHVRLAWDEVRSREGEKKLIEDNEFRLNHPHLSEWKEVSAFFLHGHQLLIFGFEGRSSILPPLPFPSFWGTQSYWANSTWYF